MQTFRKKNCSGCLPVSLTVTLVSQSIQLLAVSKRHIYIHTQRKKTQHFISILAMMFPINDHLTFLNL